MSFNSVVPRRDRTPECTALHHYNFHDYIESTGDHEFVLDPGDGNLYHVSKVGGGTLGREYDGAWYYTITTGNGRELVHGDNLETPAPRTHLQVARWLVTLVLSGGTS